MAQFSNMIDFFSVKRIQKAKRVFCFQNCSDLLWEKMFQWSGTSFESWGWRPSVCKNFEITKIIHSNSERSGQFLKQNAFLTCSWRYLRSTILEQLKLKYVIKKSWDSEFCRISSKRLYYLFQSTFYVFIFDTLYIFLLFLLEDNYVFTTIVWLCTYYFTQSAPPKNTTGDT